LTSPYPLPITVEMLYDAAWNNITSDTRQTSDISMRWGRADEASVAAPNELGLTLNNGRSKINPAVTGRYSLRNPRSDLFGKISRNTPIRVRLGATDAALHFSGIDGDYASTPDTAALDVTGDIDVRVDITPVTWRPPGFVVLASKYQGEGQWSWVFYMDTTGKLKVAWTSGGTSATRITATSTVAVPSASTRLAVRFTVDVNNGASGNTTTFYTAPSLSGTWTQLGAAVIFSGVTSIFSSAAPLAAGSGGSGDGVFTDSTPLNGRMHALQLRSGIGGSIVANPDFTARSADTGSTFTDSSGRVWTMNGNTQIDDLSVRMVGEVTNMPVEWDESGSDVWVPLTAKSISRRLGQGKSPLRSTLFRGLSSASNIVAYWPMEDGRDATSVAEAFGGKPLILNGDVTMSSYSGFAGSDAVPAFGNIGTLRGPIPNYAPNARQRIACMLHQSDTQPADRNLIFVTCRGGTVADATLVLKADGSLRVVLRNSLGVSLVDTSGGVGDLRGENAMVWMLFEQSGANINWQAGKIAEGEGAVTFFASTLAGHTYGRFTTMVLGSAGDLAGAALGHVHIVNGDDTFGFWDTAFTAMIAWDGETAGERARRLCAEEGVPLMFVGDPESTARMGKQGIRTLTELLRECAETELGVLDDHPRVRAKRFRTRETLYNQDVAFTLDYSAGEVAHPLRPIPDDQATRNDVLVVRDGGSSARAVQETGPLNVQDPAEDPDGVGRYDTSVTLNLHADSQLANQAGWRKRLGTVDEDRFPSVRFNLGRDPQLLDSFRLLSAGDRLQIINPPTWMPAESVDQLVQGGRETLNAFKHEIDLVCTPASPWSVVLVSDGTDENRADAGFSTTSASFVAGTGTSLSVATSQGPLWTTSAAQFPLYIYVFGVVLEVTNITGSSSPQTFTVTQAPVNGITKTIPAGQAVRLADPSPYIGL
jgi:hypothetical protein